MAFSLSAMNFLVGCLVVVSQIHKFNHFSTFSLALSQAVGVTLTLSGVARCIDWQISSSFFLMYRTVDSLTLNAQTHA